MMEKTGAGYTNLGERNNSISIQTNIYSLARKKYFEQFACIT